jgi:hypothetical protein
MAREEWLDRLVEKWARINGGDAAWSTITKPHAEKVWAELRENIRTAVERLNEETPDKAHRRIRLNDDAERKELGLETEESILFGITQLEAGEHRRKVQVRRCATIQLRSRPWRISATPYVARGDTYLEPEGRIGEWSLVCSMTSCRIIDDSNERAIKSTDVVEEVFSSFFSWVTNVHG